MFRYYSITRPVMREVIQNQKIMRFCVYRILIAVPMLRKFTVQPGDISITKNR